MNDNGGPIFIGGLSATGKTQMRMVLGAHPDLSLTRRTYVWNRFYGRFGALSEGDNLDRCLAAMAADEAVQQLHPDWERLRREFSDRDGYARLFGLLHEHNAERVGKPRWGEQLQFVECFADPIFSTFPNARMIHMVRRPRAEVVKHGKLGWHLAMWLHSAEAARLNARRHADQYRVVQYETFAARPLETVHGMCEFVGVDITPTMCEVLSAVRLDLSDGDPADPSASSFVDLYARRELLQLGYERDAGPARQTLTQALPAWPVNRVMMAAWRLTRGAALNRQAQV
jgi:Sulfotransferase family